MRGLWRTLRRLKRYSISRGQVLGLIEQVQGSESIICTETFAVSQDVLFVVNGKKQASPGNMQLNYLRHVSSDVMNHSQERTTFLH